MNYEGEKFLLKLYNDMHLKQSVIHSSSNSDKKNEKIRKYLERQESVHQKALERGKLDLLKKAYFEKYVIKEIPEDYIKFLDKTTFDQTGHHLTEELIKEHKRVIIEDQKKSLSSWIDYLTSEDARFYPWWAKYWAFQGMLKIGAYDNGNNIYGKRDSQTVAPFIELNQEALAKAIDLAIKEVRNEEIDEDLKKLTSSGSFTKLYTIFSKEHRKILYDNKDIEGKWIKYEQGDNYKPLLESLQGYGTGWCTAGEETCKKQLENGDFYVYYTKDKNNEYKIPRLAIRMDGKTRIGEIRGVAKKQNVEQHLEEVLDKKLEEFPDKEKYKRRINDSKMLTYIYTKNEHKKELTKEDLIFLYEIDRKIEGFGIEKDPRIEEIKSNRNIKEDYVTIFDCKIEEIGTELDDLKKRKIKVFIGDIENSFEELPEDFYIPKIVVGSVRLSVKNGKGLENLERVTGTANFSSLTDARGLENLKIIDGFAYFNNLRDSIGLSGLERVGYSIECKELRDSRGLCSLQSVGMDVIFPNLIDSLGLENLQSIDGDACFDNLLDARGLKNLCIIKGNAFFPKLFQAKGLEGLRTIYGTANFSSLADARGLCSLQSIGMNAYFLCLYDMTGLENLQDIGGESCFGALDRANNLRK